MVSVEFVVVVTTMFTGPGEAEISSTERYRRPLWMEDPIGPKEAGLEDSVSLSALGAGGVVFVVVKTVLSLGAAGSSSGGYEGAEWGRGAGLTCSIKLSIS